MARCFGQVKIARADGWLGPVRVGQLHEQASRPCFG